MCDQYKQKNTKKEDERMLAHSTFFLSMIDEKRNLI